MSDPPVWGADVSVLQGKVPWPELRRLGASFAQVRCKVGNNPGRDTTFAQDVADGEAAGLAMGPYDFAFPLPHIDPVANADAFRDAARLDNGEVLGERFGDMPPALDLEWPPPDEWGQRGLTAQGVTDWSRSCLSRMRLNTGGRVLTYSYPYFLDALSGCAGFDEIVQDVWIAGGPGYLNGTGQLPDLAKVPKGKWPAYAVRFWQFDGNGGRRLPGGVDADFNVCMLDLPGFLAMVQERRSPRARLAGSPLTAVGAGAIQDQDIRAYRQARLAAA